MLYVVLYSELDPEKQCRVIITRLYLLLEEPKHRVLVPYSLGYLLVLAKHPLEVALY